MPRFAGGCPSLLACWIGLSLSVAPAGAVALPDRPLPVASGNLDVRAQGGREVAKVLEAGRFDAAALGARAAALQGALRQEAARLALTSPGTEVRFSPLSGGVEMVRNRRGALTGPAPGKAGIDIVREYLGARKSLFGLAESDLAALRFRGESVSRDSGMRMVRLEQLAGGLPVFQSDTRISLDRDGRILRVVGLLAPGAAESVRAVSPRVTPQQALSAALASTGVRLDAARVSAPAALGLDGSWMELATADSQVRGEVATRLVYFPLGPGLLVPAWQQVIFTAGTADWVTVVDGESGAVLWRKNIRSYASTQEARFGVYVQADGKTPAESPAPHAPSDMAPGSGTQYPAIARGTVAMSAVQDPIASPDGWIPDGGTTTTGNNTDTYLDTDGNDVPDPGLLEISGRPLGNLDGAGRNRDFLGAGYSYNPPPLAGNPDAGDAPSGTEYRRGSATQLFYLTNWFHDQLYSLGFDEAAGNFQNDNFGRGGLGNDRIRAECQDGTATDNANFVTPPDGIPARMQMSTFSFPAPMRDSSLDAMIVLHELTHGLTNRILGDGLGLFWDTGGALGEGWSDFYALSLLLGDNAYPPDGKYAFAAYTLYKYRTRTDNYLYGFRRYPYCSDKTVNPLTFADVDDVTVDISGGIPASLVLWSRFGGTEVHNAGEIWANTLWDVRSRVIRDPAGADGDVPTGGRTMLQIVTDALRLTPANPSFVDARDALLDTDCATNGCANETSIWEGFANRGLGYKAVAPLAQDGYFYVGSYMGIGESSSVPYLDVDGFVIDDSLGNGNGAIDPGEPIRLTVDLLNPWRSAARAVASATATLSSSTPGVTILTGAAAYPAIGPQATAAGTPFLFTVPAAAACGGSIQLTLTATSALGTRSVDFTVRIGTRAGTGAPVTYTRTIPGGLAIPDVELRGAKDKLTIGDDFEIADLDFRIDNLAHPFTSDLGIGLRAPSGYGTTLVFLRGLFVDGDGDDFINTVIDGDSAGDLTSTTEADAPYTGAWRPAFNSPFLSDLGLDPDPVDQLSRVDGLSSRGDWYVQVADEAAGQTGQLNAWSLLVTPIAFTCAAFTPQAALSATKTAAGNFAVGGAVTYTIRLVNTGSAPQADNPGDELVDVLPASLRLISATSSSGLAAADPATNTVTWNGTLPAVVGEVTITIQATIRASAVGQTVTNQATLAFDADGNGSNESSAVSDDPATVAGGDGTAIAVAQSVVEIPTLSTWGFAALALLLAAVGWRGLRRA